MKKISKRIIIAIMTCLMLFVCISCDNEAKKYEKMRAELETVVSSVPIKTTEDLSFPKKVGDYEVTWTSSNEKVIALYSAYSREELERNTLIIEAEEKGIEKGIEQGLEQKTEEVIRKLYEKGLPIKEISEIVNKTEEEIENILNK